MDTNGVGDVAELKTSTYLKELGYDVAFPFGDPTYDIVAIDGNTVYRVQCKTGRLRNDNKASVRADLRREGNQKYTADELDAYAVYVPLDDAVCWFWFDEVGSRSVSLFVGPEKHAQRDSKTVAEYEITERLS